ncbi:MAG: diaminopimelate decarboxylase [Oscillospiraceae bacterium]|nr:diaminopimelate decarboxylase [Oscillospiraceae bacterium]
MIKRTFADIDRIKEITQSHPTPFHLYDERGIRERARLLKKAFAWNPGFREFFAVKATPNPAILRILKEEGFGTDCSSYTELLLSEAVGITGSDIMFSSNATQAHLYTLAHKLGAIINLDDFTHIDFLNSVCGIPKTICCRFNPGGLFTASTHVMDNPGDAKFGFTREQLFEGFRKLRGLGAQTFGVHAFLASNTQGNAYYPELARVLFNLAVELSRETGADIRFINLSGGIGIPYRPDDPAQDILAIGEGVRQAYNEVLVPAGLGDVALYTELGRFMLGENGGLITTAIHEKHIYKEYICVDANASNLMRPAMYKAYHHITVIGKEGAEATRVYDVSGSLCENNDKFAIDRALPPIDIGDILWIHDTGAHGHAMGYNYNGSLRSAEILLREDGGFELIRRAETPGDYFTTLVDPDVARMLEAQQPQPLT